MWIKKIQGHWESVEKNYADGEKEEKNDIILTNRTFQISLYVDGKWLEEKNVEAIMVNSTR